MQKITTEELIREAISLDSLPLLVQDISEIIGIKATLKIVEYYQGCTLNVPQKASPDQLLVKIIGMQNAEKFIYVYQGNKLDIPKCDAAIRELRNRIIFKSKKTQSELAKTWSLTTRQIRNIKKFMSVRAPREPERHFKK